MEEDDFDFKEEDVVYGVMVTEPVLRLLRRIARDVRYGNEHILDLEYLMTKFSVYQELVDGSNRAILEAVSSQGIVIKGLLDAALAGDVPGIDQAIAELNLSRGNILDAIAGLVSTVPSPTVPTELPAPTPEVPVPPLELPEPVREVPETIPDVVAVPSPEGVGLENAVNVG